MARFARLSPAVGVAVLLLASLSTAASATTTATCGGREATIVGTEGPDVIEATSGDDVVVSRGGDDRISGLTDSDFACAGDGDDTILGVGSFVAAYGGAGNDWIETRGTSLRLALSFYGEEGDDVLIGATDEVDARPTLDGGPGDDRLVGGSAPDSMYPGPGSDTVDGGGGDDDRISYVIDPGPVLIDLRKGIARGEGRDSITNIELAVGTVAADRILGDSGPNQLEGGPSDLFGDGPGAADEIRGRGGDDELWGYGVMSGGHGDDSLSVARAAPTDDSYDGGPGNDRYSFRNEGPVVVNLVDGTASGPRIGNDRLTRFERVKGSESDDTLIGDDARNVFDGGIGDDYIDGADGNDHIDGAGGDDTITGGAGNDILDGNSGNDTVDGGAGTDVCTGETLTTCE